MTSSLSPGGTSSASMSVTNPYLYSRVASSSMVSVEVDIGSGVERQAAPTGALGVRIVEQKSPAHQARVVVELGTLQQGITLRIDKNSGFVGSRKDLIGRPGIPFPCECVFVAGAAAGL